MTSPAQADPSSGALRLRAVDMLLAYVTGTFFFSFTGMMNFLIPLRAHELGASFEMIGIIVGVANIVGSAMAIPFGALVDRIGPRKAYIVGTLCPAVLAAGQAISLEIWFIFVLQVLRGTVGGMAWVASQTYITGVGTPEQRTTITGRFGFFTNLGSLITPAAIGVIAQVLGFQASFWFVAGYCSLMAVLGFFLKETPRVKPAVGAGQSAVGFGTAFELMKLRPVRVAMLLTFVRVWSGSGWHPFYLLFLQANGFSPAMIGLVFSSSSVISTLVALTTPYAAKLGSKEAVTAVALAMSALGVVISPYVAVFPWVFLPGLFMGIGSGLSLTLLLAILADAGPPSQRGVAMGIRTGTNQSASGLGPLSMGYMVTFVGMHWGFIITSLISWGLLSLSMFLHRKDVVERKS